LPRTVMQVVYPGARNPLPGAAVAMDAHGAAIGRDTELGFDLVVLLGGIERGEGGGSGAVVGGQGSGRSWPGSRPPAEVEERGEWRRRQRWVWWRMALVGFWFCMRPKFGLAPP
jgi:hypothetical protein